MIADSSRSQQSYRKKGLTILGSIVLILLIIYAIYWFVKLSHYQQTDDAYISGNQVPVGSQIVGNVVKIYAGTTDFVRAGELLVELDNIDAEQALQRSKIALANSIRQIQSLTMVQKQLSANVELYRTDLKKLNEDLQRRKALGMKKAIDNESLEHTRQAVQRAQLALQVAIEQLKANKATLLDTPLKQQPSVRQAIVQLQDAWIMMQRTKITSPVTGYVVRRNVQLGSSVKPGVPLLALIPTNELWVDANFKETQLKNIRLGQPAQVTTDLYGDKVVYQGQVTGIYAATGSSLSILPAQNATGNWIKVVQRIPVKIVLDQKQLTKNPLQLGVSCKVKIDIAKKDYQTISKYQQTKEDIQGLTIDLAPVNQIIDDIIQANIS